MNFQKNNKIGLFDSGVGGLSVFVEVKKLLPDMEYFFLADQAHVPYGRKTQKELQDLSARIVKFLLKSDIGILVVACNTATCYALDYLRQVFKIPIIGVVPALKPAAKLTKNNKIAVMSTPATAKSTYLKNLAKKFAKDKEVMLLGCKGLEDAVETLDRKTIKTLLDEYTKDVRDFGADTVVLGCTHYPFLKTEIKIRVGSKIQILDSGRAIAKRTSQLLKDREDRTKSKAIETFYTTGNPQKFSQIASQLLKYKVNSQFARI